MGEGAIERRYPFGMSGPFEGMQIWRGGNLLVAYEPNGKQRLAHNCEADEIGYGGAKGGGKSYFLDFHNAAHCMKWGKHAKTILFRRTYDELKRTLIQDAYKLFHEKLGVLKGVEQQPVFEWDNGAITWYRHLQDWEDVLKHDSAQYTLIGFDEATHFELRQYLYMFRTLRSPDNPNIHCQMLSATNPKGLGHKWYWERFYKDKEPGRVYHVVTPEQNIGGVIVPETDLSQIFIPAFITDNTVLLKNDPQYLARMAQTMTPDEYRAYVKGDWSVFMGLAFPEWDVGLHVVKSFKVPRSWKVIRSLDWGYDAPFSVGWWAQEPEGKTIYRVAEWHGAVRTGGGAVKGLGMAPQDLRAGILDREAAWLDAEEFGRPWYGVADPQAWNTEGLGCVMDGINAGTPLFRRAEKGPGSRLARKALFHSLFRIQPETGKPGLMSFDRCPAFNEQIARLMLDERNPGAEDIDSRQDDDVYDEGGYGVTELHRTRLAQRQPDAPYAYRDYARIPVTV